VRLRRDKSWVLPKGKLFPGENAIVGAKREVLEETGHNVSVHEFLGSMSYAVDAKIKIVQFWLMRANGRPARELMNDVTQVKWLPLPQAIDTLTRAHEKVFLANVGPLALKASKRSARAKSAKSSVRTRLKPPRRRAPTVPVEHVVANDDAPPHCASLPPVEHLVANDDAPLRRHVRTAAVEHVVVNGDAPRRQNAIARVFGRWIGRIAQSAARSMG